MAEIRGAVHVEELPGYDRPAGRPLPNGACPARLELRRTAAPATASPAGSFPTVTSTIWGKISLPDSCNISRLCCDRTHSFLPQLGRGWQWSNKQKAESCESKARLSCQFNVPTLTNVTSSGANAQSSADHSHRFCRSNLAWVEYKCSPPEIETPLTFLEAAGVVELLRREFPDGHYSALLVQCATAHST